MVLVSKAVSDVQDSHFKGPHQNQTDTYFKNNLTIIANKKNNSFQALHLKCP